MIRTLWTVCLKICYSRFSNFIECFAYLLGMTVSGITGISLPALEKRFQLTSKDLGVISASNDISAILLICFVSFYGQFGDKIKWIGYGAIITGERRIVKFKKRYILTCLRTGAVMFRTEKIPQTNVLNPIFVLQLTIFFSYGSARLFFFSNSIPALRTTLSGLCTIHVFLRAISTLGATKWPLTP